MAEEPDVLVQDFSGRHSTWAVLAPLMLKLIRYDDAWRAWPELATEVPSPDRGTWVSRPDGGTDVRYRIRPGVTWHDGRPLAARDVVASFRLLRDVDGEFPHREIIDRISDLEPCAGDPHAFTVRWRPGASASRFEEWGTVLPVHLLGGAGRRPTPATLAELLSDRPVFHGPYRFLEWRRGRHVRMVRHQPHPRGNPAVAEIEFRFHRSPAELLEAVAAGAVDLTELSGFTAADAADLSRRTDEFEVAQVESLTWEHIDFNLDDRHLSDRRVRWAIAHAVDRSVIAGSYGGSCQPAHSWLPRRHPAHHEGITRYPYDPARAAALLSAAGYRPGDDGILRDRHTEPLVLSLLTTGPGGNRWAASANRLRAAELVRQQLARVGIRTVIEAPPSDVAFRRFRARDFPQLAMFAWSISLEANGYLMWHSSQIPKSAGDYGINTSGWRDPGNDALLDRVVAEGEPERRHALIREQQAGWARALPSLPLFFLPHTNVYRRGLRHVRHVGAFGSYATWNCWQWRWGAET